MATLFYDHGIIGLTNINTDHYLRAQAINVNSEDVNRLLDHRLGNTNVVETGVLNDISARSAGVSTVNGQMASIEGGWAISRGIAYFELGIDGASPVQQTSIGVYGYLHGGADVLPGQSLSPEIMFVPVKSWVIEKTMVTDGQGFPMATNVLRQSSNFLLDQNQGVGSSLHTIRPTDVVENSLGFAVTEEHNEMMGGGDGSFGGSTTAALAMSGVVISKTDNDSPVNYTSQLLRAASTSASEMTMNQDSYSAIATAQGINSIKEISVYDNVFLRELRRALGVSSLMGFNGFSLGELAQVFPNFGEATTSQLTETDRFDVEDHRLNKNEHMGSSFEVLYSTELNHLANSMMSKYRLTSLSFRASNNVADGQIVINSLPVGYQIGPSAPIIDGDPDWEFNTIGAITELLNSFYAKFNSAYFHERVLVDIDCDFHLFAESTVTVKVGMDGNPQTRTYGTFAGNRFDPMLVSADDMTNSTMTFYNNLKNYI